MKTYIVIFFVSDIFLAFSDSQVYTKSNIADVSEERDSIKLLVNVVDHMKQIMNTVYSRTDRYLKKL